MPRARPGTSIWMQAATALVGVGALAAAARVEIPMVPVPMTLQTFAVLVIAGLCGWRLGLVSVGLYLAAAAAGLPVLAGGASGAARLAGPTGGYLMGFAAAAILVGWFVERTGRSPGLLPLAGVMLLGHGVILALGVLRLALHVGWRDAMSEGLSPFVAGAVLKSALAGVIVHLARRS